MATPPRAGDGRTINRQTDDVLRPTGSAFEYGVCAPECGAGVARSMADGGTPGRKPTMIDDAGVAGGRGGRGGLKLRTPPSESSSGTGDRAGRGRCPILAAAGGAGGAVGRRRRGDADRGGGGARRVSGVRTRPLAAACSGDMAVPALPRAGTGRRRPRAPTPAPPMRSRGAPKPRPSPHHHRRMSTASAEPRSTTKGGRPEVAFPTPAHPSCHRALFSYKETLLFVASAAAIHRSFVSVLGAFAQQR